MKIKENNKKNYLNQQGITLIALVITIIVLLILAAVTISTVFGENGLLKSIEIAREKTEIAEYKEDLNQKLLEAKMNVLLDNSKVLEETRKIILRDKKYDGAVVSKVEDNKFTVITKEGYKFEVTPDGAEYLEKTSGTIEENKGSIVMTAAVEGEKANITFELKTEKTKEQWATEWIEKYTVDKSESDLEGEIVKAYNEKNSTTYEDFDKYLTAKNKTREDLKKEADEEGLSYKAYLFVQKIVCSEDMGSLMEMYFAYALDLSETETDYNKQLEIINDTDKLKASMLRILEYNSFEQLLEENEITEEEFEETMNKLKQQINLTDNQALCYITILLYEPITVNVSNGDSFKVKFMNIINSEPYEYTSSEVGTLTFTATGPQGMTGSIDIEFTAAKVKLTVKHINKSGTELKATTETEYDKDTAVTVKSETISGYKTYSARITATEVNETLTEGAPVELSFGIYMDTEVVITYDVLQSGETEKEYEEKPTVSNSTEPVRVKPVEKDSSIKDSLPTDIKNSDNSYMVDIEPVKSNSGPLTITLDVSDKAEDGDTANVRHYKNSAWDDLGDFIVAQGKITFTIDSFSPFCITIKKKSSTGGEDTPAEGVLVTDSSLTSNDRTTSESTTIIAKDKKENQVVVPGGFKISGDSGETVQQGIVIEDKDGNQFVWIPVSNKDGIKAGEEGSTSTPIIKDDGSEVEITLGRYTFATSSPGTPAIKQKGSEYDQTTLAQATAGTLDKKYKAGNYYYELNGSRTGKESSGTDGTNTTAKNLKNFIEKTEANKGFYIARYEASYGSGYNSSGTDTATKFGNAKPLSKVSKANSDSSMNYTEGTLWNFITQPQAALVSQNMYKNDKYVESDLINSYAWDTAIVYIQAMGNENYANANRGTNTSLKNTGSTGDEKCKIFDMARNTLEWTTEYGTYTNFGIAYPCTRRGGYFVGSGYYTSYRSDSFATSSGYDVSFRPILYVK